MGSYCSIPLTSPPWYATFFLDPGIKWCQVVFGGVEFIHAVPWLALALLVCRSIIERCIAGPLGEWLNVKDKAYSFPPRQPSLEKAYDECPRPGQETLQQLAVDVGWSPYRVYKWFTRKRHCGRASQLAKFKESFWKLLVHSMTTVVGLYVLAQESFFWDLSKCYTSYPANAPSSSVMMYWAAELAFYISTVLAYKYDTRKTDYKLLLFHYVIMVTMLGLSYMINTVQIGVLMVFMHNVADIPLESFLPSGEEEKEMETGWKRSNWMKKNKMAKLLKYSHFDSNAKFAFIMFGVLFFITRMVAYPFYLIYSAIFQFPIISNYAPAYWIFIIALTTTQLIHLYWFRLIATMLWSLLTVKNVKELNSDSDHSQYYTHEDEDNTHWCTNRAFKARCS